MKDSAIEKQDSGRVNKPLRLADCGSRRKPVQDRVTVMEKILMSAICLFILWSVAGDAVSCNVLPVAYVSPLCTGTLQVLFTLTGL